MSNLQQTTTAEPMMVGQGVPFERIRRITGYLVGTLDRFNNAKRAEEHDRVKHALPGEMEQLTLTPEQLAACPDLSELTVCLEVE